MTLTHQDIVQRYLHAGAISRDPDAVAALFTEDGVYEAPLLPDGHRLPRRLAGRDAIRAGIGAFHRDPAFQDQGPVDPERSRFALHETADPDVFVVEIDAAVQGRTGPNAVGSVVSVVQIYRLRGGRIALLRDYFTTP